MLLKHIASTTAAAVLTALCGIVIAIITSRLLGVAGRGELALVLNATGLVFPLTSLGIKQATAYFVGKQHESVSDLLRVQAVVAPFASILTTIGAVAILAVSRDVSVTAVLLGWILVNVSSRIAFDYLSGVFLAHARMYELNVLTGARALLELAGVSSLLLLHKSTEAYLAGSALAYAIAAAAAVLLIRRQISVSSTIVGTRSISAFARAKGVAAKGALFALPMFVMGLNYGVDVAMLGALGSISDVGLYATAVTFINALWFLPNIVNLVVFAHGVTVCQSDADRYSQTLFKNGIKAMLLILPVVLLLGLTARWLIRIAFGADFEPAAAAVVALLPGGYLMIVFKLFNGDLAARGHPEVALRSFVLALFVNVGANYWLIPRYGHVGAAIASTISYSIGATWFLVNYLRMTRAYVR